VHRQNANAANQVDLLVGWADAGLALRLGGMCANSTGGVAVVVSIGEDAANVAVAGQLFDAPQIGAGAGVTQPLHADLIKQPAIGRHFYPMQEYSGATGTTTWYGAGYGTGLTGWIDG
jgi:hypothetical protein